MLHIALHFIVPAIIVSALYPFSQHLQQWKRAYTIMVCTMLVDLDHLLASPIYDPGRCSIGFHPLHMPIPIAIYMALCFFPKTRYIGLGLIIHMALDSIDCQFTNGIWIT